MCYLFFRNKSQILFAFFSLNAIYDEFFRISRHRRLTWEREKCFQDMYVNLCSSSKECTSPQSTLQLQVHKSTLIKYARVYTYVWASVGGVWVCRVPRYNIRTRAANIDLPVCYRSCRSILRPVSWFRLPSNPIMLPIDGRLRETCLCHERNYSNEIIEIHDCKWKWSNWWTRFNLSYCIYLIEGKNIIIIRLRKKI